MKFTVTIVMFLESSDKYLFDGQHYSTVESVRVVRCVDIRWIFVLREW